MLVRGLIDDAENYRETVDATEVLNVVAGATLVLFCICLNSKCTQDMYVEKLYF